MLRPFLHVIGCLASAITDCGLLSRNTSCGLSVGINGDNTFMLVRVAHYYKQGTISNVVEIFFSITTLCDKS